MLQRLASSAYCQPASLGDSSSRSPRARRGVRAQDDTRCATLIGGLKFLLADHDEHILGLVTSADISGKKPIQYSQESGKKQDQIYVRHLMTPIASIPVMALPRVLDGSIGDVLRTLNDIGSEFVLVTSKDKENTVIRGIFSARNIARSLKIYFDPSPGAKSFADFTKALHGSVLTH